MLALKQKVTPHWLLSLFILLSLVLIGCSSELGTPPADSADPGGPSEGGEQGGGEPLQPGQLTAGEWRDLDHWDFWLELMADQEWTKMQSHWTFYPTERLSVAVTNDGATVADARVTLVDAQGNTYWETKTDSRGRADLLVRLFDEQTGPFDLVVEVGGVKMTVQDVEPGDTPVAVELAAPAIPATLDLMFVVDTTGSMSDELEYLKVELRDVIERVERERAQALDVRLSVNFYRDEGDDYVVRSFPFSDDIPSVLNQLAKQRSSGGGDYPEAVDQALKDAIDDHQWRTQTSARLLFLVLDAPPHHEQDVLGSLREITERAAQRGIRIIPVASSGVDKETEFLLRFLSISTGGTYIFLTDDSGIGNDHLEPTIGQYEVEQLNDLLVRVIGEYLARED